MQWHCVLENPSVAGSGYRGQSTTEKWMQRKHPPANNTQYKE